MTEAGLAGQVDFRVADGGVTLAGLPDGGVDLLFLDAERTEYPSWWPHPVRVLRAGGVLVTLGGAFVPVFRRGKLVRVEHRRCDRLALALLAGKEHRVDDYRRRRGVPQA